MPRRRIEMCLAGEIPWATLVPADQSVANAKLDVALDDQGRLCEFGPDGSIRLLT